MTTEDILEEILQDEIVGDDDQYIDQGKHVVDAARPRQNSPPTTRWCSCAGCRRGGDARRRTLPLWRVGGRPGSTDLLPRLWTITSLSAIASPFNFRRV